MNTITENTLRTLGVETVAKFAGSINVNYLVYMNGGSNGYSLKQLEAIKAKQAKYVKENFESFISGVVKTLNNTATTATEKYLKKAYQEWYA